ncbi:hypothetical protein WN48_03951 [Eufriesea mexicana]|nr:hypothetical protein WN48_03951 [Eufriesea mexicana]
MVGTPMYVDNSTAKQAVPDRPYINPFSIPRDEETLTNEDRASLVGGWMGSSGRKLHLGNLFSEGETGCIDECGYLKHGRPDARDDISARSTRLGLGARGYTRDSFAAGGIMEETRGRARNDPHKLTPTLSSWPARKLAILLHAKADLATYHKFPASRPDSVRYPALIVLVPLETLLDRTPIPGWIVASDVSIVENECCSGFFNAVWGAFRVFGVGGCCGVRCDCVSFSGNRASGAYTPLVVSGNSPPRGEPISLATLDRDCFIIPLASLERFLPAGVPLYSNSFQHAPIADKKRPGSPLSVLEVEDPKQCVLAHFMTPLEPLDPLVESPVSRPLVLQRDTAAELVAEIAPSASQSILLTNMEKNSDFPFITYYLINKQNTDPVDFYNEVQCAALRKFDPRDLRYAASHTLDLFNEVATIARPPLEPPGVRPPIPSTGYIVSIFKVFEGDDGLKCPYDVPIFAEIGGPETNHTAQVHVAGRQDVPPDLRMFATARQSLRGGDIVARATGPFVRLHRSLQALGVLLIPQETLTTRTQRQSGATGQGHFVNFPFIGERIVWNEAGPLFIRSYRTRCDSEFVALRGLALLSTHRTQYSALVDKGLLV